MKKKLILFTVISIALIGCTDLESELYDRIPEDEYTADPILKMGPIYAPMRDFVDWSGWWFAQELTGDAVVCPTRGGDWDDGGKWRVLHQHEWNNNTEAVNSMWSRFYNGALEANKFIDEQIVFEGDPVIDEAIAKAKVLRAYYYYLLIDNYGDVPFVTSFLDAEDNPRRNYRDQIFEHIIRDIEDNIENINPSTSETGVTLGMAYSLLAKLYLNHEVYTGSENIEYWEKAEDACNAVIALGQYSLEGDPLAPFVTDNDNSPENIWVIPYDEDTYEGFNLHMRTLHYNSNQTFNMIVGPWNGFAATEDHFNTYDDNDKRKQGFLVGQQFSYDGDTIYDSGAGGLPLTFDPYIPSLVMGAGNTPQEIRMSGARVVKFEVTEGAKENLSNNFPIFRYADVLLMMAEAQLRQGIPVDVEGIDQIRTRAGLSVDGTWDNLESLLEERGREMFWEGHRRQDLIRFGKFNDAWWEKSASSPDRNTFPIPEWAIESNPSLNLDPIDINK